MTKAEVLAELDWMIKAAWGEFPKTDYEWLAVKHDPAMARTLESIRDFITYGESDSYKFLKWMKDQGYKANTEKQRYEKDGALYKVGTLLKKWRKEQEEPK